MFEDPGLFVLVPPKLEDVRPISYCKCTPRSWDNGQVEHDIVVPSVSPFPGALQLEALLWFCNLLIPNYPRWWVRHSYARACIGLDPLLTFLKRHDGTRQQVIRIRHFCRESSQLRHPGGCTDEQPGIELIIVILTLEAESWGAWPHTLIL